MILCQEVWIQDPKDTRKLAQLMADPVQFRKFCESPSLRLDEAMEGIMPPKPQIQWQAHMTQLINILLQVPAVDLQKAEPEDVILLERARALCIDHLKMIDSTRA
jgi:hypothetical protein